MRRKPALAQAREGVQDPPMSLAVRERIARETLVLEAPAGHHRRLKARRAARHNAWLRG